MLSLLSLLLFSALRIKPNVRVQIDEPSSTILYSYRSPKQSSSTPQQVNDGIGKRNLSSIEVYREEFVRPWSLSDSFNSTTLKFLFRIKDQITSAISSFERSLEKWRFIIKTKVERDIQLTNKIGEYVMRKSVKGTANTLEDISLIPASFQDISGMNGSSILSLIRVGVNPIDAPKVIGGLGRGRLSKRFLRSSDGAAEPATFYRNARSLPSVIKYDFERRQIRRQGAEQTSDMRGDVMSFLLPSMSLPRGGSPGRMIGRSVSFSYEELYYDEGIAVEGDDANSLSEEVKAATTLDRELGKQAKVVSSLLREVTELYVRGTMHRLETELTWLNENAVTPAIIAEARKSDTNGTDSQFTAVQLMLSEGLNAASSISAAVQQASKLFQTQNRGVVLLDVSSASLAAISSAAQAVLDEWERCKAIAAGAALDSSNCSWVYVPVYANQEEGGDESYTRSVLQNEIIERISSNRAMYVTIADICGEDAYFSLLSRERLRSALLRQEVTQDRRSADDPDAQAVEVTAGSDERIRDFVDTEIISANRAASESYSEKVTVADVSVVGIAKEDNVAANSLTGDVVDEAATVAAASFPSPPVTMSAEGLLASSAIAFDLPFVSSVLLEAVSGGLFEESTAVPVGEEARRRLGDSTAYDELLLAEDAASGTVSGVIVDTTATKISSPKEEEAAKALLGLLDLTLFLLETLLKSVLPLLFDTSGTVFRRAVLALEVASPSTGELTGSWARRASLPPRTNEDGGSVFSSASLLRSSSRLRLTQLKAPVTPIIEEGTRAENWAVLQKLVQKKKL